MARNTPPARAAAVPPLLTRQGVTIHYRRLEDPTNAFGGLTLQAALKRAMRANGGRTASHWNQRAWAVPPQGEETLLMNLNNDHRHYFFGDLTQFTRGFMQALLGSTANQPMLPVEQLPAPAGKEYVHSIMYWFVVGNHLLMVQSKSIGSKQLEEYLTWFLKTHTGVIGANGQVLLKSKFDPDDVGGDLDDIREIVVGGAVATRPLAQPASSSRDSEHYREIRRQKPWAERAVEVLRAVMRNEADVRKLLESVPPEAKLEVDVHIGYRVKKRSVSRAPMQEALRNLPDGEITAVGRDGRMTGKDIRLSHHANVLKNGSLLDPEDVIRAFRETYDYFVANGKIEA